MQTIPESLQSRKYLVNNVEFSCLECFEIYDVSVLGVISIML